MLKRWFWVHSQSKAVKYQNSGVIFAHIEQLWKGGLLESKDQVAVADESLEADATYIGNAMSQKG